MSNENAEDKILLVNVSKWYQSVASPDLQAIDNVSFKVKDGEFVCLLGPSGCGKSTLLHLIAGLDFPDDGLILVDGKPVTGPGSDRMMLFQEPALFPWLDVMENVLFGLKLKSGLNRSEMEERATAFLQLVHLEKFKRSYVHELSGGMKQRVALARALAPYPEVLLMDEPFAALDAMTREQLYEELQSIWSKYKKTIIFVTHNVAEAICLGDRVILFSPRPGKNHEEFKVDLPRPRDIRSIEVAQYVADIVQILRTYSIVE